MYWKTFETEQIKEKSLKSLKQLSKIYQKKKQNYNS